MIKELAFYQFNFLDSINERVLSRLSRIDNINYEVYQNSKYAIIISPTQNNLEIERNGYPEFREVYLFSPYKESLVEVTSNDYEMISETIRKIMDL